MEEQKDGSEKYFVEDGIERGNSGKKDIVIVYTLHQSADTIKLESLAGRAGAQENKSDSMHFFNLQ